MWLAQNSDRVIKRGHSLGSLFWVQLYSLLALNVGVVDDEDLVDFIEFGAPN